MSLWSTSQGRGLWRSGDQWSFSSGTSHSGSSASLNPSCDYFTQSEKQNWNRSTQQLAEFPPWFPDLAGLG